MPHTGFRLLQSPNNFQGVKLGWWIIHKWENCPRYQVKLLYRVLLSPFSLWWLTSLCNVLYIPTINLFYFISLMAGSGIQMASQPFCQNFTDMALLGLLFNRWAKKPPSLQQGGHFHEFPKSLLPWEQNQKCKACAGTFLPGLCGAAWHGKLTLHGMLVCLQCFYIVFLWIFFLLQEKEKRENISDLFLLPSVASPLLRLNLPGSQSFVFVWFLML